MPFEQEKYDTRTNNQSVKEFESSHSCHFGGVFLAAATGWPVTDCNNGAVKRHTRSGKANVAHCLKTKTLHYLHSRQNMHFALERGEHECSVDYSLCELSTVLISLC